MTAAPRRLEHIDFYVARLVAVPLACTVLITIALLVLQYLPVLTSRLVEEGASTRVVWEMLALLVPEYLDLALPISLLVGVTMAFRRLALDGEMDAITASGMSPMRLLRVPLLYAALVALLTVGVAGFAQPMGARAYDRLAYFVRTGGFGVPLELDAFNRLADGVTLRVGGRDPASGRLRQVFVQSSASPIHPFVLAAREGEFVRAPDPHMILLRLHGGRLVLGKGDIDAYRVMDFDQYDVPITEPAAAFRPKAGDGEDMTVPELFRARRESSFSLPQQHLAQGELQRRAILCVVPLLLPFLAFAVHRPPFRSESSIGLVTGLLLLVLLIKSLDFGTRFAGWAATPIQIGAFLGFAALVLRLYYISAHRAGGEPLALLYDAGDRLRRWRWV